MSVSNVNLEEEDNHVEEEEEEKEIIEDREVTCSLPIKVGGLIGIGKKDVTATFRLPKQRYYPGEDIKINIEIDNRKSSKAVKSYKFKLWRRWCILNQETGKVLMHKDQYVKIFKEEKDCCKAK